MIIEKSLDNILNSKSKIAIIRLFVSKSKDFKATGREISRLIRFSAPATHTALRELYNQGILMLDNIGRQHIYRLDNNNRITQKILRPMFKEEISLKDELKDFLIKQINEAGLKNEIVSLILYGSFQRGKAHDKSDIDLAVIVKHKKKKESVENKFLNEISIRFNEYFKAHLDTYVKTKDEFRAKLKNNLPPVSTLMQSYLIIYGKEPLEI